MVLDDTSENALTIQLGIAKQPCPKKWVYFGSVFCPKTVKSTVCTEVLWPWVLPSGFSQHWLPIRPLTCLKERNPLKWITVEFQESSSIEGGGELMPRRHIATNMEMAVERRSRCVRVSWPTSFPVLQCENLSELGVMDTGGGWALRFLHGCSARPFQNGMLRFLLSSCHVFLNSPFCLNLSVCMCLCSRTVPLSPSYPLIGCMLED